VLAWSLTSSVCVQIQKVTQVEPGRANVLVHMREKAHVVAGGRKEDVFKRNVRVEYHAQRTASGWKLVGTTNVTNPMSA
jgi:ARC6-like, IMS domain